VPVREENLEERGPNPSDMKQPGRTWGKPRSYFVHQSIIDVSRPAGT
jgi:hypothetical protein